MVRLELMRRQACSCVRRLRRKIWIRKITAEGCELPAAYLGASVVAHRPMSVKNRVLQRYRPSVDFAIIAIEIRMPGKKWMAPARMSRAQEDNQMSATHPG